MGERTKIDLLLEYAQARSLPINQLSFPEIRPQSLIFQDGSELDFASNTKPGDYLWLGIGKFSLRIQHMKEGIVIDAYPRINEMLAEVGTLELWDEDPPQKKRDCYEDTLYA